MELNYKTFGQGQPILFLHGLFGMLDNWQTFGKMVAEQDMMVYLIDQRDHGKSPFTEVFSYPILAEDLYQFMTDNWLHDAIIVGHSMGGKAAMQFANEYPDMVSKLVVVDIGIKGYEGGHEDIFKALMSIDLTKAEDRQTVADHLYSHLEEEESTIQFLLKNLQRDKETGGYRWKLNVDTLYKAYSHILGPVQQLDTVDVETLFVRGSRSPYILDEDWSDIHHFFPNASLTTINGAGHWVHAERPNELFDTIMTFVKQ